MRQRFLSKDSHLDWGANCWDCVGIGLCEPTLPHKKELAGLAPHPMLMEASQLRLVLHYGPQAQCLAFHPAANWLCLATELASVMGLELVTVLAMDWAKVMAPQQLHQLMTRRQIHRKLRELGQV